MVCTKRLPARIQVGNVDRDPTTIHSANHVWVLAGGRVRGSTVETPIFCRTKAAWAGPLLFQPCFFALALTTGKRLSPLSFPRPSQTADRNVRPRNRAHDLGHRKRRVHPEHDTPARLSANSPNHRLFNEDKHPIRNSTPNENMKHPISSESLASQKPSF